MAPDSSGTGRASRRRGLFRRRSGRSGNDAGPARQGRIAQVRAVYAMTRKADPSVTWWMLLAFAGVLVVALAVGLVWGHPIYMTFVGLPLAVLAGMFVMARKAERAAFAQIEGQPGAAGAALRALRRGWVVEEQPVAVDPRTQDSVFRAVGRPGVVLVGDGPPHRLPRLLDGERRKVARILPNVPVHLLQAGSGEGQVPLRKLSRAVGKLKPALTKQEVNAVVKRLRSLGGLRPPIPQGIDPLRARPDRRSMRGR
jgi:Domain of unknown function (DUF4191)